MRLFVALVPPAEAVEHLDEFLEVRRSAASFRWAGATSSTSRSPSWPRSRSAVSTTWSSGSGGPRPGVRAFDARIAGGGAFPNAARARVLWAGLDLDEAGRTELDRLATGCRAAANRAGIVVDGQRFRPHVTLARLGRPAEVSDWVRLLDAYAGPPWRVDRVELVASYLGEGPRGRPRYETVEELELG